jgi:aspartate aminotransferase
MSLTQRVQRIKPSPTMAITAKAKLMKSKGEDVVGFSAGEPDFDTPDFIKEAAIQAIRDGHTKYTPVGGLPALKEAIQHKLKRDNDLDYTANEILVSCGGKHTLYNIAQVLFEAGDEVLIPAPYWVSYPDQALLNDATPVIVETQEGHGFCLTPEELAKAITKKTKAIILNSPSNPTGAAYSEDQLAALAEVIVKHNIYCISDEIYEKIVYDGFVFKSIASLGEAIKKLTLTVNGASKVYSMTGWRMGFAAGPEEVIAAMTKVQGQVTSNINTPTQYACIAALTGPQDFLKGWVTEFQKRRDYILERLAKIPGIACFKPQGAFYVFPNVSTYFEKSFEGKTIGSAQGLADYLLDHHQVAVVPGEGFGAPHNIRLSYALSMDDIQKGLDRIESGLAQLI